MTDKYKLYYYLYNVESNRWKEGWIRKIKSSQYCPYHIKKEYKGQILNSSGSTRDRDSNTEKKGSLEDETTELIQQSFIICYIIYINKYVN